MLWQTALRTAKSKVYIFKFSRYPSCQPVALIYIASSNRVVANFEAKKKPLVEQMNGLISKFTAKQATIEQLEPQLMDLGEAFNDALYELWKSLMTIEMQLYERCEVR